MGDDWLPYTRQWIDDDDIAAVVRVLQSDWLTSGPAVDAFEEALAAAVGARFAVVCVNGTAALHLALLAARIPDGGVVVAPAVTFMAVANMATSCGAQPGFTDVDADSALMTPDAARAAIERAGGRAAVLSPLHFAGAAADMPALAELAREHGLLVIEDAAHAHGATYREPDETERRVGSCAHSAMTTFSFHAPKNVSAAEGGAVTTNDEALADALRRYRNHGITRTDFARTEMAHEPDGTVRPWYHEVQEPGFNYRLSDVHAALGCSQLRKLDRFVARRRTLAQRYVNCLAASSVTSIVKPLANVDDPGHAFHLFVTRIDFAGAGRSRTAVMNGLGELGIGTQVHYIPLPEQPAHHRPNDGVAYPGAAAYYETCLSLPLFPAMADKDVDRVVAALERVLR